MLDRNTKRMAQVLALENGGVIADWRRVACDPGKRGRRYMHHARVEDANGHWIGVIEVHPEMGIHFIKVTIETP